jgi:hypothetical protein
MTARKKPPAGGVRERSFVIPTGFLRTTEAIMDADVPRLFTIGKAVSLIILFSPRLTIRFNN